MYYPCILEVSAPKVLAFFRKAKQGWILENKKSVPMVHTGEYYIDLNMSAFDYGPVTKVVTMPIKLFNKITYYD